MQSFFYSNAFRQMIGRAFVIFCTLSAYFSQFYTSKLPSSGDFANSEPSEMVFTGDFAISCTRETVPKVFLPFLTLGKPSQKFFCHFSHSGNRLKKFFSKSEPLNCVLLEILVTCKLHCCYFRY